MISVWSLLCCPQETRADGFTSADVLRWSKSGQDSYLDISLTMTSVIASQLDSGKSVCIDRWHQNERQSGYEKTLQNMRENPTYHPQAVILWLVQHECGKLGQ